MNVDGGVKEGCQSLEVCALKWRLGLKQTLFVLSAGACRKEHTKGNDTTVVTNLHQRETDIRKGLSLWQ
jgi:hypothetical protein